VNNLITPRALFSPTYLLNLVQLEIALFDPPTPKTPPKDQTRSKSNDLTRRYRHLNFPRWRPIRHLGFGPTGNSAIRSADPENPPYNQNCISFHSPILALLSKLTFSPCVVLLVAVCYLGHPKNWLIDWLIETWSGSDDPSRRYGHLYSPKCEVVGHWYVVGRQSLVADRQYYILLTLIISVRSIYILTTVCDVTDLIYFSSLR